STPVGASTRVDPLALGTEFLNRLGVQVTGGSGHDVTLSANLFVSLGSFQTSVPLAITFGDVTSPSGSPSLAATNRAFVQFEAFLGTAKAPLADGLDQVAALGDSIDNAPGLSQQIDLIHGSLGSYLNLGGTLSTRLTTPLSTYLRDTDFPTIDGILDALREANGIPADGVQMTFGPGITLDVDGSGLQLGYAFDYQRSVSIPLDLGLGGPSLPISLDASANVVLTADA